MTLIMDDPYQVDNDTASEESSWKDRISLCLDHFYWLLRRPRKMRIVVIGAENAGKTSVIRRFAGDIFYEDKTDPYDDVFKLTTLLNLPGNKIRRYNTEIVEASQRQHNSTRGSKTHQYREHAKASGYVLVYDANSPYSFQKLSVFITQLQSRKKNKKRLPPIVVVGNKSELCIKMSQVNDNIEIRDDVESNGIKYFSTSAQQNSGISEVFEDIIQQCAEKKEWNFFPFLHFKRKRHAERKQRLIEEHN